MNKKKTSRTEKLVLEGQVVCVSVCVYMYSGMQKFGNPLQNLWKCE